MTSILRKCLAGSLVLMSVVAAAQSAPLTHHVSARIPVQGVGREIAADRAMPAGAARYTATVSTTTNPWKLQATLNGAVIHDISFPTAKIGYAAAELGQVWKTTDGGASWTEILNLGFPYYWYGVTTLSANEVVISGFNDSNFEGIIRWSQDGGTTWTNDIILTTTGWSYRVRFANKNDGLVMDGLDLDAPDAAHYTTDGGQTATDWTQVAPVDPNGGWFGNEFSLLPNLHARASGITYCSSTNGGAVWTCGPAIDTVFDGPVFFANDKAGWVGGGEISPNVEGWLHRTTDGGNTWSGRVLDDPWPIREIRFLTPQIGWAAGGNIYTGVGGMYFSNDGGQTWSLDISTGSEMDACDSKHSDKNYQVWCAGYDASLNGHVYTLKGTLP